MQSFSHFTCLDNAEGNAAGPPKSEKQTKDEKKAASERSKELKRQSKLLGKGTSLPANSTIPASPTPSGSSIDEEEKLPFQINDINLSIGRNELIRTLAA